LLKREVTGSLGYRAIVVITGCSVDVIGWVARGKKSYILVGRKCYFIKELREICLQIRSNDNQWQLFSLSPK
jgi:hypothetical protein